MTELLFVAKDDKCYGLTDGVLVLGHNRQMREPIIIEELCYKQIISFTNGFHHVMALTSDGKVYSWGQNNLGVLGNGNTNYEINKPKISEYLINEVIIDMSSGAYHLMVLTQNIELYVWGIMTQSKLVMNVKKGCNNHKLN